METHVVTRSHPRHVHIVIMVDPKGVGSEKLWVGPISTPPQKTVISSSTFFFGVFLTAMCGPMWGEC